MTVMNQKDAVFTALKNVFGVASFDAKVEPTKEQRAQVNAILLEGFRGGTIGYDGDFNTLSESDQKSYVSGLQSNWLRKDKRLNGNVTYVAKNPGSRAGSTDPQIKAMRALLATKTDAADRAQIQSFIDKRISEVKPTKSTELTEEQIALLEANGLGHLV